MMSDRDEILAAVTAKLPKSLAAGQIPQSQMLEVLAPLIDELATLRAEVRELRAMLDAE